MKIDEVIYRAVSYNIIPDVDVSYTKGYKDVLNYSSSVESQHDLIIKLTENLLALHEDVIKAEQSYEYKEKINKQQLTINLSALNIVQEEHKKWQVENFGYTSSEDYLIGATEELGELCHAFLKRKQKIRNNETHTENITDAVADIIIFLAGFCNNEGIDMEGELNRVWNKVKQRNWNKNKNNGQVEQDLNQLSLFPGQ